MSYLCPHCAFGNLKPIHVTYVRRWGLRIITVPDFSAWRCDACNYTRYDAAALAQMEMILGVDEDEWFQPKRQASQTSEGPGTRGPRRWSF